MESTFIFAVIFGALCDGRGADRAVEEQGFLDRHRGPIGFGVGRRGALRHRRRRGCRPGSWARWVWGRAMPCRSRSRRSLFSRACRSSLARSCTYWLQMAGGTAKVLLFTLIPAIVIAVAVYYWFKFILPDRLRESPSFDLAALILTLSLFMLSAGALVFFNPAWKLLFQEHGICQRQVLHGWQFPHQRHRPGDATGGAVRRFCGGLRGDRVVVETPRVADRHRHLPGHHRPLLHDVLHERRRPGHRLCRFAGLLAGTAGRAARLAADLLLLRRNAHLRISADVDLEHRGDLLYRARHSSTGGAA